MLNSIWGKIKDWAAWTYKWVTVLVASIIGTLSLALPYLDQISATDLSALLSSDRAAKIMAGTAIAKAVISIISAIRAPKA